MKYILEETSEGHSTHTKLESGQMKNTGEPVVWCEYFRGKATELMNPGPQRPHWSMFWSKCLRGYTVSDILAEERVVVYYHGAPPSIICVHSEGLDGKNDSLVPLSG